MNKFFSFDIFDTLITRPFLYPTDLFEMVANRLIKFNPNISKKKFKLARINAERAARLCVFPKEDCSLDDIYSKFNELHEWKVSVNVAKSEELDVEWELSQPIVENIKIVNYLYKSKKNVVFLSDMYLPSKFIHQLLSKHGIKCSLKNIFVSNEIGLTKSTGNLYRFVIKKFNLNPGQIEHLGDNLISDFQIPKKLGIIAKHYKNIKLNRYERIDCPKKLIPLWKSTASGTSRASRLSINCSNQITTNLARVSCNVIAPILVSYVSWVLENATKRGIQRLYFVSRDGQIFYKIASTIRNNCDPECKYIYGSRQAWFLPSVFKAKISEMDWAWPNGMPRRAIDILRRLEIYNDETIAFLKMNRFDSKTLSNPLDESNLNELKHFLTKEPLRSRILIAANQRRKLLLDYFCQEGLFDGAKCALVDVGWTLKCQTNLNKILLNSGVKEKIEGYYFAIGNNHEPVVKSGPCNAFITPVKSDLYSPLKANWIFKLPIVLLIEHLFTIADHPTVKNYQKANNRIIPVFKEYNSEYHTQPISEFIHTCVLKYSSIAKNFSLINFNSVRFMEYTFKNMQKFCLNPLPVDVDGVAWLPTNKDQSHETEHFSHMASPLKLSDIFTILKYEIREQNQAYFTPKFAWLTGSAAISTFPIRIIFKTLYSVNQIRSMVKKQSE